MSVGNDCAATAVPWGRSEDAGSTVRFRSRTMDERAQFSAAASRKQETFKLQTLGQVRPVGVDRANRNGRRMAPLFR